MTLKRFAQISPFGFGRNRWTTTPPCWRPSPPSPYWRCHEPCWCHLSHTFVLSNTQRYQTSAELITSPPSLKNIPTEVMHNVSDLHGILLLVLLAVHSVVDLKLTWPKCFYKCWKYKEDFDVNHRDHSILYQRWKKFQLKWYIQMLAASLVFSSLLSLASIVSSTSSHVRNVVTNAKNIKKTMMSTIITRAYHILVEKIQIEVIHHYVKPLPGLLLYYCLKMFLPATVL